MPLLTPAMRDVLVDHLDGRAVPIVNASALGGQAAVDASRRMQTTYALMGRGFLRADRSTGRPRATLITAQGRVVLIRALASWAEALVAAGAIDKSVLNHLETIAGVESPPCELPTFLTPSSAAAGPTAEPSAPSTTP